MTLFAEVVAASKLVTATGSRSRKVAILAGLLRGLDASEVPICVAFLSGVPRQGRVGVGYSTIYEVQPPPAAEGSLTVGDVNRAIDDIAAATGSGSATRRRQLLGELLGRATEQETDFIRRLFTGELRQGALAGLMADAVAHAAGVSSAIARRALMLSGDLALMAEVAMTSGEEGLNNIGFEIFPTNPPDARFPRRERGRGARGLRTPPRIARCPRPTSGEFVMVGKCFRGLTDELLEWQTKELLKRETGRRGIAVQVRPELVVGIALDGVQSSTRYPGGVALRFARVKRYRPDKNANQADTIDDLRALLRSRSRS